MSRGCALKAVTRVVSPPQSQRTERLFLGSLEEAVSPYFRDCRNEGESCRKSWSGAAQPKPRPRKSPHQHHASVGQGDSGKDHNSQTLGRPRGKKKKSLSPLSSLSFSAPALPRPCSLKSNLKRSCLSKMQPGSRGKTQYTRTQHTFLSWAGAAPMHLPCVLSFGKIRCLGAAKPKGRKAGRQTGEKWSEVEVKGRGREERKATLQPQLSCITEVAMLEGSSFPSLPLEGDPEPNTNLHTHTTHTQVAILSTLS